MSGRSDSHGVPQQGDEAALFELYGERLERSVARALGAERRHAEDACAWAWAQLVATQPERGERIFAWLRATAINHARRLGVLERREAAPEFGGEDPELPWEELIEARTSLEVELEGRAAAEALAELRPREARYLSLLAAGYSYREIAEREGVTYRTVDRHISRSRARIRERRS